MTRDRLGTAANVATIVAVLAALSLLAGRYVVRRFHDQPRPPEKIELRIQNRADRVVLLVLASDCRFCTESADLYRRIIEVKREDTKVVAWMPERESDARAYLNGLGLIVDEVVQARPAAAGTRYTPTVVVTDSVGNVRTWLVGKLPPNQETELLASLSACNSCASGSPVNGSSSHVQSSPEPPELARRNPR
jgi:hypothetical protein